MSDDDANALKAFRAADLEWAVRLRDVWRDPECDVPELHARIRASLTTKLADMRQRTDQRELGSPLGWVIVGPGGSGKTHLLGAMRREAAAAGASFVLVDMTDVRDFWETLLQGYLSSLQEEYVDKLHQHEFLLRNVIKRLGTKDDIALVLKVYAQRKTEKLANDVSRVLTLLAKRYRSETHQYQDVVRALICLNSNSFEISNAGMGWLQSQGIEEDLRRAFGFRQTQAEPRAIVTALSWIMSLGGPTIVAFDQLDPIVHQMGHWNLDAPSGTDPERDRARSIIEQIGGGLSAIRDVTTNSLAVVSCVERTWHLLNEIVLKTYRDRYEEPVRLQRPGNAAVFEMLIRDRLARAFAAHDFIPPYPTWPFSPAAIHELGQETPREVLKLCDAHRRRCIEAGRVYELDRFSASETQTPTAIPAEGLARLDSLFESHRSAADIPALLDEKLEDEQLGPLYVSALQCLIHEHADRVPTAVEVFVDKEFSGGKATKPLHARLHFVYHDENSREEHFCVRALQRRNHSAFKTRLKSALTESGIDKSLKFRHLVIVRTGNLPGGPETAKLTDQFQKAGGQFYEPAEEELRTLAALHRLIEERPADLQIWLRERQPVTRLGLAHVLAPGSLFDVGNATPKNGNATCVNQTAEVTTIPQLDPAAATPLHHAEAVPEPAPTPALQATRPSKNTACGDSPFPFGRRLIGVDRVGDQFTLPLRLLAKHTMILGGSGSGKSVTVRRMVEEAALLGIPSIIIDAARDMLLFDERWPEPPSFWHEGDACRAERFHAESEMVVWTPGRESGNPLCLQPLPDFTPFRDDPEELEDALQMAAGGFIEIAGTGNSAKSQKKQGILLESLRFFAKHFPGGSLQDYIELLRSLPPEAGIGVQQEAKLAVEIADSLMVEVTKTPLLRTAGTPLDPGRLFGDDGAHGRTRISVISLVGLSTDEMQVSFVNQLAMLLFSWIKKNPHPPNGRPLRGLLVIDEARDLVPSRTSTACKESLMCLAAQARKYGLGLIFATQHPKDVETKVVGNCATHLYGLNNSPASLATLKELMSQKGGSGNDIARLKKGQFYLHNSDTGQAAPIKVQIPMSLSRSPDNPLEETAVMEKARRFRGNG